MKSESFRAEIKRDSALFGERKKGSAPQKLNTNFCGAFPFGWGGRICFFFESAAAGRQGPGELLPSECIKAGLNGLTPLCKLLYIR